MIKRTFYRCFAILLLFISTFSYSQDSDSVRLVFARMKDPEKRLSSIVDYGKEYFRKTPQVAKAILEYGVTLADSLKDDRAAGTIKKYLGIIVYMNGDHGQALKSYTEALQHFESIDYSEGVAEVYNEMGNLYRKNGNFKDAKRYLNESIEISSRKKLYKTNGTAHNNLGVVYETLNDYDSALINYRKSAGFYLLSKDSIDLSYSYSNIGGVMGLKKVYDSALYYMEKGLNTRIRLKDEYGVAISYINLAELAGMKEDYNAVIEYATKGIAVTTKIGFKDVTAACYDALAIAYEEKGNIQKAYESFKLSKTYQDSIFNDNKSKQLVDIQTKYETEKKEQEIASLKQKNTIHELTSSRQRTYYGSALLLVGIGGIALFQFQKNKRFKEKTNLQLELQKQQEQAARDVIDAEMNERRRIAEELHDGVGQIFSAARMNLSGITSTISFSNTNHQQVFEKTLTLIDEGCQELRSISHAMMPEALLKKGLPEALRELVNRMDQSRLAINLEIFGIESRLSQSLETNIYRIIQEAISNTLKHAEASTIDIQLGLTDNKLDLTIEDNGKGFTLSSLQSVKGIGMKNIVSRVNILNGTIDIDTQPVKGTLLVITIPYSAA